MSVSKDARRVQRRRVLTGAGIGALGLVGAALFGCRAGGNRADRRPSPMTTARSGGSGLALTAPVVRGRARAGGVFTQAIPGTFRQHDAHTALGLNIWHVIGEKALEIDPTSGAVLPHMVTSWEIADRDGLSLVFKLKPGVTMHNIAPWHGRDFTSEDVAFNMTRVAGLTADRERIPVAAFQRASLEANFVKAEAVDALTVRVTLSGPNSAFFNGLTDARMPMMPKEMIDVGFGDPLKMGGTGPFRVSEWVKDEGMRFARTDRYFRPGEPHFDEFNATVIPDPAGTQAAFVSGQTQMLPVSARSQIDAIQRMKPDALLYEWIDSSWQHLRPNMSYEPFQDYRVRRALFLSIDYANVGDGYFGSGWGYQAALCPGYPEAWTSERVKALPGFNPGAKVADRAEAAKLLAASGYPGGDGIDFDVAFTNSNDPSRENATRFQAQMLDLYPAMNVALRSFPDSAAFSGAQTSSAFRMLAYVTTSAPDPVLELTSQYRTGGSRNYGRFADAELDRLLDRAILELNPAARGALLDEIQRKFITAWLPMFVLYAQPARNLLQENIGGYDRTAGTWYGFSSATKGGRWFYVDK